MFGDSRFKSRALPPRNSSGGLLISLRPPAGVEHWFRPTLCGDDLTVVIVGDGMKIRRVTATVDGGRFVAASALGLAATARARASDSYQTFLCRQTGRPTDRPGRGPVEPVDSNLEKSY